MPEVRTAEQYQRVAIDIAARARTDNGFYQTLLRDPASALRAQGISGDALRELLNEDGFARARLGPAQDNNCEIVSCVCSDGCCVTCWVGSSASNPMETLLRNPSLVDFGGFDPGLRVAPSRAQLVTRLVDNGHLFPKLK